MKDQKLTVKTNKEIARGTYMMWLSGDCSEISAPGQFINIRLEGFFLRRPISIHDYSDDHVDILYRIAGRGTAEMALLEPGAELSVLMPLGNGFDASLSGDRPLLVGGGIGAAPLLPLARKLKAMGKEVLVVIGSRTAEDMLPADEFKAEGITPVLATEDGSLGIKGFVTDAMKTLDFDYVYACGPEPMLRAIAPLTPAGQFSFEERMGCGFGACMGCSCKTKYGYKRICTDGPVLDVNEIIW